MGLSMSNYCVSFRIANKTVNGRSYSDRRQELIDKIREEHRGYWDETTSFILVESSLDTVAITRKGASALSAADDLLFIFDPDDMSAAYFGRIESVDVLRSFFPRLQKVP
jgi:hypothetical protein